MRFFDKKFLVEFFISSCYNLKYYIGGYGMFDHLLKKNRISLNILLFIILFFAAACSNGSGGSGKIPVRPGEILLPGHPEKDVLENDSARIDVSNLKEGYFAACYFGSAEKAKLQLTGPDGITYTYDMPMDGSWV